MKNYKSSLPEISLKLTKGGTLNAKIKSSSDAVEIFRKVWDSDSLLICESVICIFLNRANNTIGWFKASQGGLSATIIDNRLILATALKSLASGIIIAHNHPSGNSRPSDADIDVIKKLKTAAEYMDINVVDNIILTDESYYSMVDEKII